MNPTQDLAIGERVALTYRGRTIQGVIVDAWYFPSFRLWFFTARAVADYCGCSQEVVVSDTVERFTPIPDLAPAVI